jgi:hypothetical protein
MRFSLCKFHGARNRIRISSLLSAITILPSDQKAELPGTWETAPRRCPLALGRAGC